jgi:adenosylhomocysteine nucleosidase
MKGAVCLSDLIQRKKSGGNRITKIVNYGIAGCLSDKFSIGDVVEIDKVIKYDPVEFLKPKPGKLFLSSFPDIIVNERREDANVLATSDHPIFIEEDSKRVARYADFVDMEGYGYAFVASHYNIPIRMLKGVSDFALKHSEEAFKQNVRTCLEKLLIFHKSSSMLKE